MTYKVVKSNKKRDKNSKLLLQAIQKLTLKNSFL